MNEVFNAVYDSTMQAWYTDPMEGEIRIFRQFNAGDMRIYTETEVSDENPDGWKIVKNRRITSLIMEPSRQYNALT